MERAEETDVIEPVEESEATPARRGFGVLSAIMVVNVGVVLALAWLTYNMSTGLESTHQTLRTQLETTNSLQKKVETMATQQVALENEVAELRQFVASRSEEDVIFLKIIVTKRDVDRKLAREIARHVHKYSQVYGQDPDLVLAIMKVESNYDPNVVSHMGATGLMQVMPQWKQVLGIRENLTDPETSIRYGLQILGFYRNMYKDLDMALTAYNRGPGPVDMALMRGKSPHNGYAPKVMQTYKELQSLRVGTKKVG